MFLILNTIEIFGTNSQSLQRVASLILFGGVANKIWPQTKENHLLNWQNYPLSFSVCELIGHASLLIFQDYYGNL
jgi:hypothetical protein